MVSLVLCAFSLSEKAKKSLSPFHTACGFRQTRLFLKSQTPAWSEALG